MATAGRQDITITGRTIVVELADRNEIEWQLSATPDLEWAEVFQLADPSSRTGSIEWIRGGGPDVIGGVIRWFVPDGKVDEAEAEVRHRLSVANRRLATGERS